MVHEHGGSQGNRILDQRRQKKVLALGKPESGMSVWNLRCQESFGFPESLEMGQQSSKSIFYGPLPGFAMQSLLKHNQFVVMR